MKLEDILYIGAIIILLIIAVVSLAESVKLQEKKEARTDITFSGENCKYGNISLDNLKISGFNMNQDQYSAFLWDYMNNSINKCKDKSIIIAVKWL